MKGLRRLSIGVGTLADLHAAGEIHSSGLQPLGHWGALACATTPLWVTCGGVRQKSSDAARPSGGPGLSPYRRRPALGGGRPPPPPQPLNQQEQQRLRRDPPAGAPAGASLLTRHPSVLLPYPVETYKQLVAEAFDPKGMQAASAVDLVTSNTAKRLMELAELRPGNRVLDVATGSGLLALQAARAVQPGGQVLGLDLCHGMVAQARRAAAASQLSNVELWQADAEAVALPAGSFDTVLALSAVNYMAHLPSTLALWRTWLRPGGRLVLNCFKSPYDPECGLLYQLAQKHGLPLHDPLLPLGCKERVTQALQTAGYQDVQVDEQALVTEEPAPSAQAYAAAMWHSSAVSPHHNVQAMLSAAQQHAGGSPGHSAAAGPGPSLRERLAALEGDFKKQAVGLIKARTRSGTVRTAVGVMFVVARA